MSLFAELKRRNLFRVAAAYVIVAWLLLQVSDVLAPALLLPDWFHSGVAFLLILGFPVALVLSWAFELTPEGIRRDTGLAPGEAPPEASGHWSNVLLAVALLAVIGFIAWDRLGPTSPDVPTAPVVDTTAEAPGEAGVTAGDAGMGQGAAEEAEDPGGITIAVLPFADMSPDRSQEYMGDGIAEEMLNLLAKIPELRVISRSSAFSFKGTNADIPTIAGRLGATHVLEGSVRTAGDQVRITAQLIEAGNDIHVWSETYDRQLDNIFAIQDEISQAVVEVLRLKLVGAAPSAIPADPKAYELALKGRFHWLRRSEGDEQEALRLYKDAVAIDPTYGPAWTGLSVALAVAALKGRIDREPGLERAHEAAVKGVELTPQSAEALVRMGQAQARRGDYGRARASYDRALAMDPNSSLALGMSAVQAWRELDPERAVALYRRAEAADPMSTVMPSNLAGYYTKLGRVAEARAALDRVAVLVPDPAFRAETEARLALMQGKLSEASEFAALINDPDAKTLMEIMVLESRGDGEAARARLADWLAGDPLPHALERAQVHAWLNQPDQAFAALDELEQIELYGGHILFDTVFANLYEDSRWAALERRMRAYEWPGEE